MHRPEGLIQHSFAVRISRDLSPAYAKENTPDAHRLLRTLFEEPGYRLGEAGMGRSPREVGGDGPWDHSVLVRHRQTTIEPHPFPYKEAPSENEIPGPLDWNAHKCGRLADLEDPWEGFVIGGADRPGETSHKDYLLELDTEPSTETVDPRADDGVALSQLLCQLLAHRRSRLFGLPLARETINVLLPHALFKSGEGNGPAGGDWFVQPVLSLFYVYGRRSFRPIFSFSLFLVPCNCSDAGLTSRSMSEDEIHDSVRDQWPLATAFDPGQRPKFIVSGPFCGYLSAVAGPALGSLDIETTDGTWTAGNGSGCGRRTLRMFTEATLFAIALRMAGGNRDLPPIQTRKEIGDRVLTSLSASRVSSVVVVDDNCAAAQPASEKRKMCRPSDLSTLLAEVSEVISRPYQAPPRISREDRGRHRLDRDFFDTDRYAIGVLPANRCVVMVGDRCAQNGFESSALLEAGGTAYMVIGAATATGMIRSVFRDISRSDRSKPDSIADIEREAMVELHETYDLEITTEVYRRRYRQLRKHLGITAEFEALSDKLEALYRETSTRFEGQSEKRLQLLTWATAILSAVIAAGTLVLIFKGG